MRLRINASTSLSGADYDAEKQRLDITFKSGASYTYENVPPEIAEGLERAQSPGQFYHNSIKNVYG